MKQHLASCFESQMVYKLQTRPNQTFMSVRLLYSYVTLKVLDFVSWKTTFYCDYSSVEKTLLSYTSVDSLLFFPLVSGQLLLSWFSLVEWMLPGPLSLLLMLFSWTWSFEQFLLTSSDVLKIVNTKRFMGPMLEKRYILSSKRKQKDKQIERSIQKHLERR